jgi:TPR repeat protein
MRPILSHWPFQHGAFKEYVKQGLMAVCCACLLVASGRLTLSMTYSYALEAHSVGDYATALPIVYGNAIFDDSGACGLLGTMYLLGQGVERNGSNAEYWLLKAAANGSVASQSVLGTMYATGKGVPRNDGKAQVWFSKAAAAGDISAVYALRQLHKVIPM